ncbi:MAG: hypothetical protein ACTSRW_05920 [Candidatus Helarchaeota archaeon]
MKKTKTEIQQQIIAIAETGIFSRKEIAKRVGCSPSYVSVTLMKHGPNKIQQEIINEYRKGKTHEEIASKIRCSMNRVERILIYFPEA